MARRYYSQRLWESQDISKTMRVAQGGPKGELIANHAVPEYDSRTLAPASRAC